MNSIREQLKTNLVFENSELLGRSPQEIVVSGMGGSAVVGELLYAILPASRITTHRSYGLPPVIPADSLVLVISYSGTTEETLSSYDEAMRRGVKTAVISGGGELLEKAQKDKVPYVKIPYDKEIPARFAVGYLLRAGLEILGETGKIANDLTAEWRTTARDLARRINKATLLIYTPPDLVGLGLFWKEALNETAKLPAFSNTIPEATHNEIESITVLAEKYLLLIRDPRGERRIWERFRIFAELATERGWPVSEINLSSPDRITDLIHVLILALKTSIELAKMRGVDPISTPLIDEVKKRMK